MTIWCMRIACWIPNASNIPSEYVILVSPRKQPRTHLNVKFLRTLSLVKNVSCYYQFIFMSRDVWIINRWNYKKKLRGLSPRANYTDRVAAAGRRRDGTICIIINTPINSSYCVLNFITRMQTKVC